MREHLLHDGEWLGSVTTDRHLMVEELAKMLNIDIYEEEAGEPKFNVEEFEIITTKKAYGWITVTDKFLSGWGMAKDKVNKMVIECESIQQFRALKAYIKTRDEMTHLYFCQAFPKHLFKRDDVLVSYKIAEYHLTAWREIGDLLTR